MNKYLLVGLAMLTFSKYTMATQADEMNLKESREHNVKQYIMDLQNADYKDITQLFENNGWVISTSRGKVNAKDFFYAFLPNISTASTELHQYFTNDLDPDRLAARFHFAFKLKDGEEGEGEYIDEFIFSKNSKKLATVYMFENLKFKNNLNALALTAKSQLPTCPSVAAIQTIGLNNFDLFDHTVNRLDTFQTRNSWYFSLDLVGGKFLTRDQAIKKGNDALSSLIFKSGPESASDGWPGYICKYSTLAGEAVAYQET